MPIYEYICNQCGKKFEALRSIKDADAAIECKYCNNAHTQRALSVCYAHGTGGGGVSDFAPSYSSGGGGGCGGCSGGSCGSCHH
jgi:putative FmdB family regulatory protein